MHTDLKDIGKYIPSIGRGMRIYYDRGLMQYNIGWAQQFFLEYIYANPGVNPQTLTEAFHIEKGTTSKALKKLYEEGYITVAPDSVDLRGKRLYPTETAKEVIQHIKCLRTRLDQIFVNGLSEQEICNMQRSLEKLHLNLKEELSHE